jgi:hypothetical protein
MPKLGGINRKKIKDSSGSRGEAAAAAAGKKQKQAKKRSSAGGTSKQQLSAAQLYERAQQALAFERYDAALESLRDACELEPDAVEYVDAAGALLAELGRGDEAVQVCWVCVEGGGCIGLCCWLQQRALSAARAHVIACVMRQAGGSRALSIRATSADTRRHWSVLCSCRLMRGLRSTCTWGSCWRGRRAWLRHSAAWRCCSR